jgi:hypothetical protein
MSRAVSVCQRRWTQSFPRTRRRPSTPVLTYRVAWCVALGSGKRLFAAPGAKLPLKLIDSATFDTGVVGLTFAKA